MPKNVAFELNVWLKLDNKVYRGPECKFSCIAWEFFNVQDEGVMSGVDLLL